MNWTQEAAVRSSIGAPEVVRQPIASTRHELSSINQSINHF